VATGRNMGNGWRIYLRKHYETVTGELKRFAKLTSKAKKEALLRCAEKTE
jgi:putative component of toxin-antitoxin plasmid stabilization module